MLRSCVKEKSLLFAEFWRHSVLSHGTQCRAMPRHQREINLHRYFISSRGDWTTILSMDENGIAKSILDLIAIYKCRPHKQACVVVVGLQMISDYCRSLSPVILEEQMGRCRPLRWRQAQFLEVPMSYQPGNTAVSRWFHGWVARGRKFLRNRTVVECHESRWYGWLNLWKFSSR